MSKQKKTLHVQISPHFFYNTLNGMLALNRMGEKKRLEKTIMNLSDLCRYSSVGEEETATVEEECMIEEQYLELENLRYDDRIRYEFCIEDECNDRKIPRMALWQAMKNSIAHAPEDGEIMIKVHVSSAYAEDGETETVISVRGNKEEETVLKFPVNRN